MPSFLPDDIKEKQITHTHTHTHTHITSLKHYYTEIQNIIMVFFMKGKEHNLSNTLTK